MPLRARAPLAAAPCRSSGWRPWGRTQLRGADGQLRRCFPSREALTEFTTNALANALETDLSANDQSFTYSAVDNPPGFVYRTLQCMSDTVREQYMFWAAFAQSRMGGCSLFVLVLRSYALPAPQAVQQCSHAKRRGCVIDPDVGQVERMCAEFGPFFPERLSSGRPSLILRVPAPHAVRPGRLGIARPFALAPRRGARNLRRSPSTDCASPSTLIAQSDLDRDEERHLSDEATLTPPPAARIADFIRSAWRSSSCATQDEAREWDATTTM